MESNEHAGSIHTIEMAPASACPGGRYQRRGDQDSAIGLGRNLIRFNAGCSPAGTSLAEIGNEVDDRTDDDSAGTRYASIA